MRQTRLVHNESTTRRALAALVLGFVVSAAVITATKTDQSIETTEVASATTEAPTPKVIEDLSRPDAMANWDQSIALVGNDMHQKHLQAQARAAAIAQAEARKRQAALTPRPSRSTARVAPAYSNHGGIPAILIRIRGCESGHNYTARNPSSSASGAYQFIDGTWRSQARQIEVTLEDGTKTTADRVWPRAYLAPPNIQDQAAIILYNAAGTSPWNASRSCWQ